MRRLVATNIRAARDAAHLTQREVARRMDVEQVVLSRWEHGRSFPSLDFLVRYGRVVDRTVDWFYTQHSSDEPDQVVA